MGDALRITQRAAAEAKAALEQLRVAVKITQPHLRMRLRLAHPVDRGTQVIAYRREVDGKRRGKTQGGKQRAVLKKLRQFVRIGHDNAGALQQVLQSGYLREDRGQRRHLDIMAVEGAHQELPRSPAKIYRIV